jgi:toxin ParE1/3/4
MREAASWWAINRPEARNALPIAIRRTLAQIGQSPGIGRPAPDIRQPDVRRYLVRRVHYYVYYRVKSDLVEILAVWHTSRGSPPPI